MTQTIINFITAISEDCFIEAHEILEHSWKILKKEDKREEALLQKGLINGTTAIGLHLRGKTEGARRVWQTFEKYRPLIGTVETELTPLYREAEALLDQKHEAFCPNQEQGL